MKKYILTLLLLLATTLFTPAQVALSTFDFNAKACDEEVKLLALFTGHTVDEIIEFMKPSKRYDFAYLDTMTIYPLAKEEAKKLKGRHSKLKIQNRDTLYFGSGLDDGPVISMKDVGLLLKSEMNWKVN